MGLSWRAAICLLSFSGLTFAATVPGVVIAHSPASTGIYIGSPSIAFLPNGDYVVSHDEFGPRSTEATHAVTRVFGSSNRGQSWTNRARVEGQFWSTLFFHKDELYLIGTDRHHGNVVLRRSNDNGYTWSSPLDASCGLLREGGQYHCAPVPVIESAGRLWRAMERRVPATGWGITYCAGMISAAVESDLLNATNWSFSNFLPSERAWLGGTFGGWLEGNAVVGPDGQILDVLRVESTGYPEKAALVKVEQHGNSLQTSFEPQSDFINFPGGAKKFTIRYDEKSKKYWAVATIVPKRHEKAGRPGGVRNTLALTTSPDLRQWTVSRILLYHPDTSNHGFQYVDWQFEGEDLVAVCRTAYDDERGGAHNAHDANFLTFHRIRNFRQSSPRDSVPLEVDNVPAGRTP